MSTNFLRLAAAGLLLAGAAAAQVCPSPLPAGFEGLNGNGVIAPDNEAILNIYTATDSTDAIFADNTAHAALGETLSIRFEDARVAAGQPFTLAFSTGVQPFGINSPLIDGNVWLNAQSVFPLVDGLGLFGAANFLGSTAGPNLAWQLYANTGTDPNFIGLCATLQVLVFDPLAPAPYYLAVSNPTALGIVPGISAVSPAIVAPGGQTTVYAPGLSTNGGDAVTFWDGTTVFTTGAGNVIVPATAISGQVSLDLGGAGIPSTVVPDSIVDFVAVTAPIASTTPGPMTFVADPNLPFSGGSRATGFGTLAQPGAIDVWTVTLNAGDVLEVEVYSIDSTATFLLDGVGAAISPYVPEGFDPIVSIEQTTNGGDTLVFDQNFAGAPPFLLHFDDDDGPENNSYFVWQAKYATTYNLVVGDANPNAFVSGDYLINVRRYQNVFPCATSFLTGTTRTNVFAANGTMTVQGANLFVGQVYDVVFIPMAGSPFTTRTAANVACTVNGRLTVPVPAAVAGNLTLGLHQIQIVNATSGIAGYVWDNTRIPQGTGPLCDVMSIRGATVTQVLNTSAASSNITNIANQSLRFGPTALNANNTYQGFFTFTIPAGVQAVYVEALGTDGTVDRFDSHDAMTNANGIYNPFLRLFTPPNLLAAGPVNDDDGLVPAALFPFSMGIALNAALIDFNGPAFNPNGGVYSGLVVENVVVGSAANHACLINVSYF